MRIIKGFAGKTPIWACYEEKGKREESPLSQTCTAPIIMVFPEGALNESEVVYLLKDLKLDVLSANLGSVIAVVQPSNGSEWTESDYQAYLNTIGLIEDSSDADIEYGIVIHPPRVPWIQVPSMEQIFKLSGTLQRVHVIAIGRGADLIGKCILKPQERTIVVARDKMRSCDMAPVSVLFIRCNMVAVPNEMSQPPMSLVFLNAGKAALEAVREFIKDGTARAEVTENIGGWINDHYLRIVEEKRRQCGVLIKRDYIGENCITRKKIIGTITVAYALYIPIERENDIPLIMTLHGGGNTALYQMEASGWLTRAYENGLAILSVDHHVTLPAEILVQLIDKITQEFPFLSKKRTYVTGFSMGAVKTWELAEKFPSRFAGIAPMDAATDPAAQLTQPTLLPCFYVGGTASPLEELPHRCDGIVKENRVDRRMAWLLRCNDVCAEYTFDANENPWWGKCPDAASRSVDPIFPNTEYEVSFYRSNDGEIYTALCAAVGKGHEVHAFETKLAWEFLRRFSRDEDGHICIAQDQQKFRYTLQGGSNAKE